MAAFRRFLPDFLLPGPLVYAQRTDTLVTPTRGSRCRLRYAQLVSADEGQTAVGVDANGGDSGIASTKKVTADWSTNVGEGVMELAVGAARQARRRRRRVRGGGARERTLFFLSDGGAMLRSAGWTTRCSPWRSCAACLRTRGNPSPWSWAPTPAR